ncbi:hypothetical protein BRADI_1g78063v3 [Brachypodium distachyon]|uniref:RING-type domain-containing protein n=2 Tax=Brachypodium distachyon TaxID=15368 RepID=A0A2K2DVQ3_BRADI|nr:hypothetical protein BRADI_1g78063v3 [Brachypodium distachyon]
MASLGVGDGDRHRARADDDDDDDVVRRMAVERQHELRGLSDHRAVSAFAHRGRIQSFLRGSFVRSERHMHDDWPLSTATRELGQLRQSRPVARLREEVRSRTENITHDQAANHFGPMDAQNSYANSENHNFTHQVFLDNNLHLENATRNHEIQTFQSREEAQSVDLESTVSNSNDALQDDFDQEHMHGYEEYSDSGSSGQGSEQSGSSSSNPSNNSVRQDDETYGQPTDLRWSREISGSEEEGSFLHGDEEWHVIDSQEGEPQWQSDPSVSPSPHINRFSPPDGDVYGVELRELLSRRSVSNLLSSGFRESLDQLIQSYARRQELDPPDWEYGIQIPTIGLLNEDHAEHGTSEPNQAEHDTAPHPPITSSGQTLLPQQRHWQLQLPHHNWSQQNMHQPEFEWDAIHVLRDDLTGLQRGMVGMQQMLEACMEMQVELQRSIKQEVSAALNRSVSSQAEDEDGSQWKLARKGTCCVCCDKQIDSLLYRCGHMCTCSKCARELLHGVGRCPLCRAPIVEVVRAYCIM